MPRPEFTLKTLLWLMAVVAAFCTGAAFEYEWRKNQTLIYYLKLDIKNFLNDCPFPRHP